jgi:S1-C subfamily serine protease
MRTTNWAWLGSVLVAAMLAGCGTLRTASDDGSQDLAPWQQIQQNTAASFVIIDYYPQKSDPTRIDARDGFDSDQRRSMERILGQNTATAVGVILNDTGEVFTTERELQYPQNVAKITVTGWDGKVLSATADRILTRAPGRIIRITEKLPETWKVLKFAEFDPGRITPEMSIYVSSLRSGERNRIGISGCDCALGWKEGKADMALRLAGVEGVGVLCDAQGRPIGVSAAREIELGPTGFAWLGRDILADKGVSVQDRTQLEDKLRTSFADNIYEMTLTFRPPPSDELGEGGPYAREGVQERLVYGLAFADDKLLVLGTFGRSAIEGIDTVSVKAGDKSLAARFGGVLKSCEAMVFELQEGKLPRSAPFAADARVARTEPFWSVGVRELAGKDVSTDYARWVTKEQGYAEKWYPVIDRSIPSGTWLVDREGRLVGLLGRGRQELDRLRPYLAPDDSRYGNVPVSVRRGLTVSLSSLARAYAAEEETRMFDAADLASALSNPADNYDSHIRHLTKEEQKRRMWLGVEYTRPSKEMVKQMNLRSQTQDGRIGLVVNRIYRGSPATKLGLAEGDILLKIAVPEAPWPIDLVTNERTPTYELPNYDEEDAPEELRGGGARMSRGRPWPSRDNYLTRMLGDIGAGTSVKLTYLHDGQSVEKEFVVEQAPPDLVAAAKYKDEKLGLTVKDLTYEVRAALRLTENDSAVVVTEIRPGTPAAMARINLYELIRAVDSQAVDSVQTFEKLVTEAQKAQKDSVRITVEWMGKTRLADLKFNARGNGPGLFRSLVPGATGESEP